MIVINMLKTEKNGAQLTRIQYSGILDICASMRKHIRWWQAKDQPHTDENG